MGDKYGERERDRGRRRENGGCGGRGGRERRESAGDARCFSLEKTERTTREERRIVEKEEEKKRWGKGASEERWGRPLALTSARIPLKRGCSF